MFEEESKNRAHPAAVKSVRTKKVIKTTTTVVHTGGTGEGIHGGDQLS